jgi:hypothetical protein
VSLVDNLQNENLKIKKPRKVSSESRSLYKQKRNGKEAAADERIKPRLSDLYSKDFEYHLNDEKSFPLTFTKHIRDPVPRHRFYTANTGDAPDFPYWNLLRQKWLLSAQPRRLSQVRLFHKRGIETNERNKRSTVVATNEDENNFEENKKGSPFYLFNLLKRNKDLGSTGSFRYMYPPYENLPYHRCYLNNVSCWRK